MFNAILLQLYFFQNRSGMWSHMKNGHDRYVCPTPTCGRIFVKQANGMSAKSAFERHRKTRCGKPEPPKQYGCRGEGCNDRFSNKRDLSSHEGKCSKVTHQCSKCKKDFKNRYLLSRHKCTVVIEILVNPVNSAPL